MDPQVCSESSGRPLLCAASVMCLSFFNQVWESDQVVYQSNTSTGLFQSVSVNSTCSIPFTSGTGTSGPLNKVSLTVLQTQVPWLNTELFWVFKST